MPGEGRWHLSQVPMLWPAAGVSCGIALGAVWSSLWVLSVPAALTLAALLLKKMRIVTLSLSAMAGVLLIGAVLPPAVVSGRHYRGEGIVDMAVDYGSRQKIVVATDDGYRLQLTVYDYPYLIERGERVSFSGVTVPAYQHPSVPEEYTGRRDALARRLSGRCVLDDNGFEVTAEATGVTALLTQWRGKVSGYFTFSTLSQPASEFLRAVILGENAVGNDLREDFSKVGLSHTLALSGSHVAVVSFMVAMLFFPVVMAGRRKVALWMTMVALWGYPVFTGCSPSVVRAVIMGNMLLMGKIFESRSNSLNSLLAAALLILVFSPESLFKIGFQMSFLAAGGIIMLLPMVNGAVLNWGLCRGRWVLPVVNAICLPIVAVIATAPLSVYYFHSFPLLFLLSNLVVAAVLPLMIGGGLLFLILRMAGFAAGLLGGFLNEVYGLMASFAHGIAELQGEGLQGLYLDGRLMIPIYAGLLMLWLAWNCRRRFYLYNGLILIAFTATMTAGNAAGCFYPEREVYVWHPTDALAVVVRDGGDVYLLTDAAPKHHGEMKERAEAALRGYLCSRGAREIRIAADSLDLGWARADRGEWVLGSRRYLLAGKEGVDGMLRHDAALDGVLRHDAALDGADGIIITRGFKGDGGEIGRLFPDKVFVVSPAVYPSRRAVIVETLKREGVEVRLNLPPTEGGR